MGAIEHESFLSLSIIFCIDSFFWGTMSYPNLRNAQENERRKDVNSCKHREFGLKKWWFCVPKPSVFFLEKLTVTAILKTG